MALIDDRTEREINEWMASYLGAFGSLQFGGTAGLDPSRVATIGTTAIVRSSGVGMSGVGGALTTLEQAYLAGKLAGEVGTNLVRRMSERQLRDALERTGISLTDTDRVRIAEANRQSAASLRLRSGRTAQKIRTTIEQSNRAWNGDLESGRLGLTVAARRTDRLGRLRQLDNVIRSDLARMTFDNRRFIQTQSAQYFQEAQVAQAPPEEIVYKIPRMNAEFHCMRLHLSANGQPIRYRLADVAGNSNIGLPPFQWRFTIGPVHPFCVLPGTRVFGRDVEAVSERRYEGEIVIIHTASGKLLRVTPNHPILTDRGWVAAGLLHEGAHVIRSLGQEWEPWKSNGDVQDMPARVEDVAESFRLSPTSTAYDVPGAAEHFHGDGIDGEIGIIWSDRLLRDTSQSAVCEHPRQGSLVKAVEAALLFSILGFSNQLSRCPVHTASGFMGGLYARQLDLVGFPLGSQLLGSEDAATFDAGFDEAPMHDRTADAERARQSVLRLSGEIALDEVVQVDRKFYSGHVFNLQTREGWYFSESIASKNCYCILHRDSKEPLPAPNKRRAEARSREIEQFRQKKGLPGGEVFPSDRPGLRITSQARRRGRSRSGLGGAARIEGDTVLPATPRDLLEARQIQDRLAAVTNRGSIAAEVSNLERSARSDFESALREEKGCCIGVELRRPEDYEKLLHVVKSLYGEDSPAR